MIILFLLHVTEENILNNDSLKYYSLLNSIDDRHVIFPMGYKTQEVLKNSDIANKNIEIIDPIGYLEFMHLLKNQIL